MIYVVLRLKWGFWSRTSCIDLMSLSPIVLIGLFRMVTPTRLVAYHVVVTPLVGDSFHSTTFTSKEKCVAALRMFRLGPTRFCSFAFETNSTVKQWSKELVLHLCNLFFRVNLCGAAPELLVQRPVGGRTPPKATRCVFFFPHPLTTHFFLILKSHFVYWFNEFVTNSFNRTV